MRHTLIVVVAVLLASCSPDAEPVETTLADTTTTTRAEITTTTVAPPFGVSSPAFAEGAGIPTVHTCDGSDISPELNVIGIPEGTNSIVVIVDDLDAPLGTWDHWVEYDIPTTEGSVVIPGGADKPGVPGVNSWNLEYTRGRALPPASSTPITSVSTRSRESSVFPTASTRPQSVRPWRAWCWTKWN